MYIMYMYMYVHIMYMYIYIYVTCVLPGLSGVPNNSFVFSRDQINQNVCYTKRSRNFLILSHHIVL